MVAFCLAVITSIPQIHLWYVRGSDWNGSCALTDPDELPYLAYTNALIEGRPRRNDPYAGKDNSEFETLFSIQFLPPYAVAIPARTLRMSGDSAFIILLFAATIATFFVIWWLLIEITQSSALALIGAICVISFSTAAAHSPFHILKGIETGYDPFPFLRRYIPALPFPIFLAATIFVWRALTRNVKWAVLAGLSFAVLVYSYFFLWTALAAWFFTCFLLWVVARPADRKQVWQTCAILAAFATAALTPYSWLVTRRIPSMDSGQILELRHTPDLLRAPELYGALILLVLVYQIWRKSVAYNDRRILFVASFALCPFIVFNQQIVTGRSLQSFHYEEFAANYWIVAAVFLALGILRQKLPTRILFYLGAAGLGLTIMLGLQTIRLTAEMNVQRDRVRPPAQILKAKNIDGVVFASDRYLTHEIPSLTGKPVLWARYLYTFSNVSTSEQKQRYFRYLYYSGVDETQFMRMIMLDFTSQWEVFGAERVNPILTANPQPISQAEFEKAADEYKTFTASFNSDLATKPLVSYAVVSAGDDLSNLDRWYERDSGEKVGEFVIYHLKVRPH